MEQIQITIEQAYENLVAAAKDFRGTLKDHHALQISLQMIRERIFPKDEVPNPPSEG